MPLWVAGSLQRVNQSLTKRFSGCDIFRAMPRSRSIFSIVAQFFMVFAFLCAPIADSAHAMRMLQTKHDDSQSVPRKPETMLMTANAPCHKAMMMQAEASTPDKTLADNSDDKKPCCPYKQCSPSSCLMHFAVASMPTFEILSHSPNDNRVFIAPSIHLVPAPYTERLRPPIT